MPQTAIKIPKRLQPVFWSKDVQKLDLQQDRIYIVHHVLALGSWEDLIWLFHTYAPGEIRRTFLEHPMRIYRKPSLNFVKNTLFFRPPSRLYARHYLKTVS